MADSADRTGTLQPLFSWTPVLLPVSGQPGRGFPVRRVFCVGRNYADHAREMGADPAREPPFFFMKPANAVTTASTIRYPSRTADLHHEVELVVAVGTDAQDVTQQQALASVFGCAVGLDLTRRDLQAQAKELRRPWEAGKCFSGAAPCGELLPGLPLADAAITLHVGAQQRQCGHLDQMIWGVGEILAELSVLFGLLAGDLVFTGTPAGVAAVTPGDVLDAEIDGLPRLRVRIDPR